MLHKLKVLRFLLASNSEIVLFNLVQRTVSSLSARSTAPIQPFNEPSFTHRKPMLPVELSGVFFVLAATRYRLQYDLWQR